MLVPKRELVFVCATNVMSQIKSHGILTVQFEYHFSAQNGLTTTMHDDDDDDDGDNFYPRHLKLWNGVFQTMDFSTELKKISCRMHFNNIMSQASS